MGIVLMNELKNVTWNFYDQRNREWVDNWSVEDYPNQRPSMVYMEISFWMNQNRFKVIIGFQLLRILQLLLEPLNLEIPAALEIPLVGVKM